MDSNKGAIPASDSQPGGAPATPPVGTDRGSADPLASALPTWDLVPATQFLRRR